MDKQAILDHINHAIVLLGTMKVRVDEIATVGVPASEAIQHLGEAIRRINASEAEEAKPNEQENSDQ